MLKYVWCICTPKDYPDAQAVVPLLRGHIFSPSLIKGVVPMVTYEELFLLGTLLVSIIALVINITKKK